MSSQSATRSIIYLGMDVHKDSITIAVLPAGAKTPTRLERLPNDLPKLKKWIDRVARDGEIRACYEASGAGYVLHRALQEWGYACDVIAPSLIPKRPGVQRKHDKRDATDLARLYRARELVAVRIPSEADERVRDIVRCRETFQRESPLQRRTLRSPRDGRRASPAETTFDLGKDLARGNASHAAAFQIGGPLSYFIVPRGGGARIPVFETCEEELRQSGTIGRGECEELLGEDFRVSVDHDGLRDAYKAKSTSWHNLEALASA